MKDGSKPYQAPLRRVVCALQETLKEEIETLQKQQCIVPLSTDETSELCNSFGLVPKVNSKVIVYLDLARLNKALIRPAHKGPTLNDILLRLAGIKYLTLINASSGYHSMKLEKRSFYLTKFLIHLAGRYT